MVLVGSIFSKLTVHPFECWYGKLNGKSFHQGLFAAKAVTVETKKRKKSPRSCKQVARAAVTNSAQKKLLKLAQEC